MAKREEKALSGMEELSDDALNLVVGGKTIPQICDAFADFQLSLTDPPATLEEIAVINRIKDSLHTQGLKAAKALSKRLTRPFPRLYPIVDMIPSP